ncbi:MAG: 4-hydroxy-tetrahydrodipicolinate synthase [Bacteroidetes bacterium RBG_13_43_22]|nr:MAG: 4-hydroxy-tetrahydrodipicolinate synthase [Bacteroidetes bacterium RBG_13_43_22]
MKKFEGTGVAIVTPFLDDTQVDYEALGRVVNHVIEGGVNYIVVMGTTGEASTLSLDEKKSVLSSVNEAVAGRVPLVVGIGGNNTAEVIRTFGELDLKGIDGILSVAPYYNKPSQNGLFHHFKTISENSPLPLIIYNVPGRTSCNIASETCLKLAHECRNIVAVKEASGDLTHIMKIIKGKPEGFLVISGDDMLTLPIMAAGGAGVISVLANAYPMECSSLVNHLMKNDYIAAREMQLSLIERIELCFADGNPSGIKAFLSIMNLCRNNLRLPLVPVNQTVFSRIQKAVEEAK